MDETTLAAELLADKFSTHSSAHDQVQTQVEAHFPTEVPTLVEHSLSPDQLQQLQAQAFHHPDSSVAAASVYSTAVNAVFPPTTISEVAAINPADSSSEPVQAYAKLEGDSFCYYIRTLQVTFGRKASSSDHVDVHLGPTKAISRQHARLFYNFTTQRFEMTVFGKNGAFVNDLFVEKGVTVPLENRTKIQIGEVSFSFLLPKIEAEESVAQEAAVKQGSVTQKSSTSERPAATKPAVKREPSSQPSEPADASDYSSRDQKPPYSYASLIAQAINSTTQRKLTLNGIYQYITTHFPYYQMQHNGWQNSIRHNLSLNKAFVKVPRADSEPGKGAFWTIDQSCESQFANGIYKRSRRAVSSKPGARPRSDSEQPEGDKPNKRINLGTDANTGSQQALQQQAASATSTPGQPAAGAAGVSKPMTGEAPKAVIGSGATATQSAQPTPQPDYTQLNQASLTIAALLQQNPALLALIQQLSQTSKDGTPSALLSALVAAANSNIPGTLPATARALLAHLQQIQQQAAAAAAAAAGGAGAATTTTTATTAVAATAATLVTGANPAATPAVSSLPANAVAATITTAAVTAAVTPTTTTLTVGVPAESGSTTADTAAATAVSTTTATGGAASPEADSSTPKAASPNAASSIAQLVAAARAQAQGPTTLPLSTVTATPTAVTSSSPQMGITSGTLPVAETTTTENGEGNASEDTSMTTFGSVTETESTIVASIAGEGVSTEILQAAQPTQPPLATPLLPSSTKEVELSTAEVTAEEATIAATIATVETVVRSSDEAPDTLNVTLQSSFSSSIEEEEEGGAETAEGMIVEKEEEEKEEEEEAEGEAEGEKSTPEPQETIPETTSDA